MKICVIIWASVLVYVAVIVAAYQYGIKVGQNQVGVQTEFFVKTEGE